MSGESQEGNNALVLCDLQADGLKSLGAHESFLSSIRIALHVARKAGWTIVHTGLKLPSGYDGVLESHRLYGALRRLNSKVGDAHAHWFMEGYDGSEIDSSLLQFAEKNSDNEDEDIVVWRQSHLPSSELIEALQSRSISKAVVVGIKAGYAVQATVQALCDEGLHVSIVKECVSDDVPERLEAVVEHLVPIYADVVSLEGFVDEAVGLHEYVKIVAADDANHDKTNSDISTQTTFHCTDCGRGGHMPLYMFHLLRQAKWSQYPTQQWYNDDFNGRQYKCPLGQKLVDFCDEPRFSKVSMFLSGREWLDEKDKAIDLIGSLLPETYVVTNGSEWLNGNRPSRDNTTDENSNGNNTSSIWFVKECDKNGGRAVQICKTIAECEQLIAENISHTGNYVIQSHIHDPALTAQGHKCHAKFYSLLQCGEDGISWKLHTYKDAFLATSPNPWSSRDITKDTQVTNKRTKRILAGEEVEPSWPMSWYNQCKEAVSSVIGKAVANGKLLGRPGKKQFEIFSADFMFDTSGSIWLIEFNFGPVLFDPLAGQPLSTESLQKYQRLYDLHGTKAVVHDTSMIRDAVSMIFTPELFAKKKSSRWDPAGFFEGKLPETASSSTEQTTSTLLRSFATIM